ncbi:MAG TPA: MBL fold metallo-hydrolase [Candidatus Dormibacteraeota bacterium]|jgi:UDP-MurNAc hydroxylase|nr:MBL fold metallo-hydrolase [Candidatus Dormibacteraeota bacterium]
MRVTYYGQACTLTEAGGLRILTDPWLTEGAYQGTWFHTHLLADAGVRPEHVAKGIDYLFLSHEHQDHLDVATLKHFPSNIPVLICRFATTKFRKYLEVLGFTNIREVDSGQPLMLEGEVAVTIFSTAEYTNDSAILIEHNGVRMFNETDCKLAFGDLEKLSHLGIDIGFYMFSGANWYPILYDYPEDVMLEMVRLRRRSLLRSLVQRVKLTKPRFAVPAAGPCMVLAHDLLALNDERQGIFIDPEVAVRELGQSKLASHPLYMVATDVWDSDKGFEPHAPAALRVPRSEYIRSASERMAPQIAAARAAEPPAHSGLGDSLVKYFDALVGAQTESVRRKINAKLAFDVTGPQGGKWTVDFSLSNGNFVREGILPDWTYKIEVEDKLISPFVTGQEPFFEDLLLSLRFRCSRRPDQYNEPLYHFLYEPDPEKLQNWYAQH